MTFQYTEYDELDFFWGGGGMTLKKHLGYMHIVWHSTFILHCMYDLIG